MIRPEIKATASVLAFSIVGTIGWLLSEGQEKLPMGIFFIALLVNTFFSIKIFSSITPPSLLQNLLDSILFVLYVLLAFAFSNYLLFSYVALLLFMTATLKYAVLLGKVSHPRLLKNKLTVDLMGSMLCALALGGSLIGYTEASAWIFATVFVFANIIVLLIYPIYRLDKQ